MLRTQTAILAACLAMAPYVALAEEGAAPAADAAHHDDAHAEGEDHGHEEGEDHGHEDHGHEDHDHGHDDHDHDHGHIHGAAHIDVELSGNFVTITTELPGGNLFPEDMAKEDHSVQSATTLFDAAGLGLVLPEAAACTRITYSVSIEVITEGDHEGHSDVTAKQIHLCEGDVGFATLDLNVFEAFPKVETVLLHASRDGFAVEAELTAATPVVPFAAQPR